MEKRTTLKWTLVLLVAGITGFSTAGDLRNLPADYVFPPGEGSPGPVTFSHATHVDSDRPRCLECHPSWFRILVKGTTATEARITHDAMEKSRQACGACHGTTAFGFEDCENCHKM